MIGTPLTGFLYLVAVMDWFTRKVLAWRSSAAVIVDLMAIGRW